MTTSFRLFRVRGIDVKMHITFPLILIWAGFVFGTAGPGGFSLSGAVFGVVVTLILFVCVVIHELSHSLAALRMGYPVREIVLLPLGGVAQIEKLPELPRQELIMSLVGPLSNVVIGGVLLAIVLLLGIDVQASLMKIVMEPAELGWSDVLPYLTFTNFALAAFNLIPAFPMDGGRVLRALLATSLPFARATAIAVSVGQAVAWMLGLAGLLTRNVTWILVAVFVFAGAAQEGRMIRVKDALRGLLVRHAFSHGAIAISPGDPISRAADLTFESFQADFPVCTGDLTCERGSIVGLLTYADTLRALRSRSPDTPVREVMRSEFPRVTLDDELFEAQRRMSEAKVDAVPVIDDGQFLGLLTRRDISEVYQLLSVSPELITREQPA
jgi:stage IV sporulation protein FB